MTELAEEKRREQNRTENVCQLNNAFVRLVGGRSRQMKECSYETTTVVLVLSIKIYHRTSYNHYYETLSITFTTEQSYNHSYETVSITFTTEQS